MIQALAIKPSTESAQSRPGRPWGRFELRGLFGRSDQSMAWLAYDPRRGSEVMLLLPRVQPRDAQALSQWRSRASAATHLSHPGLLAASEVGVENGWPFVVIDRSVGVTLGEWLMSRPTLPHGQCVDLMCEVLQGLACAHEAGFTHGDIEPYSILIDAQGRARLSGLVVASAPPLAAKAEVRKPLDDHFLQTKRTVAQRDVLNAGLLFHRLLVGQMPMGQADFSTVIAQMAPEGREFVRVSRGAVPNLPEALRAIVNRSTSSKETQRYSAATNFLAALGGWRASQNNASGGPLALLMERLAASGHLPVAPHTVRAMEKVLAWDTPRNNEISERIVQDVSLSLEMLRQVNRGRVQDGAGHSAVITVRRAVAMLGTSGVRRSLQALPEWPGNLAEPAAAALMEDMNRARLGGGVAQVLAPAGFDPEVLHLVTLMQSLGRMLVQRHFPNEAQHIRELMQPEPSCGVSGAFTPGLTEEAASFGVLGINSESLALAVVASWGLGDDMLRLMRRIPANRAVHAPSSEIEWFRIAASAANEVVEALTMSAQNPAAQLAQVVQRYDKTLGFSAQEAHEAVKLAREAMKKGELIKSSAYLTTQPMVFSNTGFGEPEEKVDREG